MPRYRQQRTALAYFGGGGGGGSSVPAGAAILAPTSTTALADPTSAVLAIRDAGDGWIEVDYDDDVVAASDLPSTGIVVGLTKPTTDIYGEAFGSPPVGQFWLSLEIDAVPPANQFVALVGSDVSDLSSGNARGCGFSSDGSLLAPRSYSRTSNSLGVATALATYRRFGWHQARFSGGGLTTQRASTVTGHAADGSYLAGSTEIGAQAAPMDFVRLVVGHSGAGPGGTQTARVRPRVFAFSASAALGIS